MKKDLTDKFKVKSRGINYEPRFQRSSHIRDGSGTTYAPILCKRESWRLRKENLEEFLKFIEDVEHLKPMRLTSDDSASIEGECYRGTDVFLMILACYSMGAAFGVKDFSNYNPENRSIEIKYVLATPSKSSALSYGNKYIEKDGGKASESFRKIEEPIFKRALEDNDIDVKDMPDFLLQPLLLALNGFYHNEFEHKPFEGICFNPKPNHTTLELLAKLFGIDSKEFKEQYPILSSCFSE